MNPSSSSSSSCSSCSSILRLLLLLASLSRSSSERRLGCLFESDLCSPYEICVNDGVFGRCHSVPVREVYTYDVSTSVVQRFRMLLEKLSNRGLTWQDDTTQQVLSKELSKLRRIPFRPQQSGPVYKSNTRPVAEAMDPVDQRVKPVEVELSRNLQSYLQRLGLLPETLSSASLSGPPGKSDRFQSGFPADAHRPKAQTQSSSPSSFYSPLSSRQPLEKQRPLVDQRPATQSEGELLLGALRRYLSGRLSLHAGGGGPEEPGAPSSRPRPSFSGGVENPGLRKETSTSRLLKTGRTQGASVKEPLSSVDERFIEKVLKNVGRQHVDVDNLSLHDLDQLSSLIADALQVVDKDQGLNRGLTQARTRPRDLEGEMRNDGEEEKEEEVAARDEEEEKLLANAPTLKPQGSTPIVPAELQERHTEAEEQNVKDTAEDGSLVTKLLAYLDKTSLNSSPSARNWHDVAVETARGQPVGLENVQSRTSQVGVAVQKKDAAQSVEEVSEVQGWIKEVAPPPAALVYEEPHKKTMHVPELQLDVKDSRKKAEDDVFGYVITDTDGLQTDEGLHLMEILALRARIQMTDFAELSVVGPAVTFRVSPNAQNVSTTDVANVAAENSATSLLGLHDDLIYSLVFGLV